MEYKGFEVSFTPWPDGDVGVSVYDEEWDYDHGQINPALSRINAVKEGKRYCDEIRAKYPTKEAFMAEYAPGEQADV